MHGTPRTRSPDFSPRILRTGPGAESPLNSRRRILSSSSTVVYDSFHIAAYREDYVIPYAFGLTIRDASSREQHPRPCAMFSRDAVSGKHVVQLYENMPTLRVGVAPKVLQR